MLKNARDRKGLTQQELAQEVGLSVPTIVRAEQSGLISPTTGRMICDYLDVDLAAAVVPRAEQLANDDDKTDIVA
jgi:transcriptional regulator with XRE-family HTH domain